MKLIFFNTLNRKKEIFNSISESKVTLYTCGPTVYNKAHIGNLRTYIFEDLLRRVLIFFGYKVNQVMNITDVDDKTIKGALEKNCSLEEFTQEYKDQFFKDLESLNILKVEQYPEATRFIPQMIHLVKKLIDKGYAYEKEGNVFFKIEKFDEYGALAHLQKVALKPGASNRIADEYEKDGVADFVLWKTYNSKKDGDIFWDSPWGKGRPGWHTECSAMALSLLGNTIDIHCGGVDNIFPHHENEIAQSKACTGKHFVNYWLHAEHLLVDGKKMSKSLNNFYTLSDLTDLGFSPREIRLNLLQTHYRTQLDFSLERLRDSQGLLRKFDTFIGRLKEYIDGEEATLERLMDSQGSLYEKINDISKKIKNGFADDLHIDKVLALLFPFMKEINALLDQGKLVKEDAERIISLFEEIDQIFGVLINSHPDDKIHERYLQMLKMRDIARAEKDWNEADRIRDLLDKDGYVIEDTKTGSRLKRK